MVDYTGLYIIVLFDDEYLAEAEDLEEAEDIVYEDYKIRVNKDDRAGASDYTFEFYNGEELIGTKTSTLNEDAVKDELSSEHVMSNREFLLYSNPSFFKQ